MQKKINISKVKCISFDLWLTLIAPNRQSHEARTALLSKELGVENNEEFSQLIRSVSKSLDVRAEETHENYSCADRINLLCDTLHIPRLAADELVRVSNLCQESIRSNQPTLLNPNTATIFKSLKSQGYKLALISNTGYPEAPVMREILSNLGIAHLFDCLVFSSEVGRSKPSPAMLKRVAGKVGCDLSEILHIGDSIKADYEGALLAGSQALHFDACGSHMTHAVASLDELLNIFSYLDKANVTRSSLYTLTTDGKKTIDQSGLEFSADEYSRFKHGDSSIQEKYGHSLAQHFINNFNQIIKHDEELVIAPFAYMNVPTAAGNMMPYFHDYLGSYLKEIGKECAKRFHVYKYTSNHSQDHNYAKVSIEERKRILDAIPLSVDEKQLEGKTVVMIDDIYITGNSEQKMLEVLEKTRAKQVIFLYVAYMDPSIALEDPGIESRLNQSYVRSLQELSKIMKPGKYSMNLRNCKFILESDFTLFKRFIKGLDTSVILDIYRTCLSNSYYLEKKYVPHIDFIVEILRKSKLLPGDFKTKQKKISTVRTLSTLKK